MTGADIVRDGRLTHRSWPRRRGKRSTQLWCKLCKLDLSEGHLAAWRGTFSVTCVPRRRTYGVPFETQTCLSTVRVAQLAPRRPRGIYAVVNVEENIKKEQATKPSITTADLKAYFVKLYQDLRGNLAVSGLAIWVNRVDSSCCFGSSRLRCLL